ncbi:MAG: hypothetical protein ACSW8I_00615 [bacterium]
MKRIAKKLLPFLMLAAVVSIGTLPVSCQSSKGSMYERKKSNSSRAVKSNIKVKGTNKANSHTTRTY